MKVWFTTYQIIALRQTWFFQKMRYFMADFRHTLAPVQEEVGFNVLDKSAEIVSRELKMAKLLLKEEGLAPEPALIVAVAQTLAVTMAALQRGGADEMHAMLANQPDPGSMTWPELRAAKPVNLKPARLASAGLQLDHASDSA
jgi:hypothetical protein